MDFRSRFKIGSFKRAKRTILILGGSALITIYYQNCSPVGDSAGIGSVTATSTTTNCSLKPAPTLSGGIANQTMSVGLGPLSGNVFPAKQSVTVKLAYPGQGIQMRCKSSLGGINVTCNAANNINVSTKDECVSGTATITVEAEDIVCKKRSNPITFQVTATSVCTSQNKIHGISTTSLDQFGAKVVLSGTTAVVVSPGDDDKALDAGAAYVFKQNGSSWDLIQKLIPASMAANDTIQSVAISGNTLVLGSPYHNIYGAAFVYRFNGTSWVEGPTLTGSQHNATFDDNLFGQDVAISGNTIVVGAPGFNHMDLANFKEAGAVFVYSDSGSAVNEVKMLTASDSAMQDYFGFSVAVSGSHIAVGAPSSPVADKSKFTGKTYVFETGSWAQSLVNPDCGCITTTNGAQFGTAVALDGDRLAVGAPTGAGKTAGEGVALVYTLQSGNWVKEGKVIASDGNSGDLFGQSVALKGGQLAVGSPWQTNKTGAAYLYRLSSGTWSQIWKLVPRKDDRAEQDRYGESVSLSDTNFMSGSRLDDDTGLNTGSAFIIGLP